MKYRIVKDWVMVYNDTGLILLPPRQMNRKFPRLAYLASLNDSISGQDISFS